MRCNLYHINPFRKTSEPTMLEADRFPWGKRTVLCIGGVDTTTTSSAASFARQAASMIGKPAIAEYGVQLLSAVYPDSVAAQRQEITDLTTLKGEPKTHCRAHYGQEISDQWMEEIFLPHIRKTLATASNHDAAAEKLSEDFSKLTIFAFSLGSYVTNSLHTALKRTLQEEGFNAAQTTHMLRQVHVLTIGDIGIWHTQPREGWDFTSLHTASTKDFYVRSATNIRDKGERFLTLANKPHIGLMLHSLSPTGHVVNEVDGEHDLMDIGITHSDKKVPGHHPRTYTHPRISEYPGGLFVPTALEVVLRNMVSRDTQPAKNIQTLLQPQNGTFAGEMSTTDYYETRLAHYLGEGGSNVHIFDQWPKDWRGAAKTRQSAPGSFIS